MRILVTGSRHHADRALIRRALDDALAGVAERDGDHRRVTVVHGDAAGADRIAATEAHHLGCRVEAWHADWATHGKAAGPRRNQHMVNLGADVCLAFPLGPSHGTRDCIRRARAAGIEVREWTS